MLRIPRHHFNLPCRLSTLLISIVVGSSWAHESLGESIRKIDTGEGLNVRQVSGNPFIGGDSLGENRSVSFKVRLGRVYGESAGGVVLAAKKPEKDLTLPGSFAWLGSSKKRGLEVITDPQATRTIRQALTPSLLLDMVADPQSVHGATVIRIYHRPDPLPMKIDSVYPVAGLTPFYTHRVEALATDEEDRATQVLAMSTKHDDPGQNHQKWWLWTWMVTPTGETGWDMQVGNGVLKDGGSLERVIVTEAHLGEGIRRKTRITQIGEQDDPPEKKVVETFRYFPWGEEIIEKRTEFRGELTNHERFDYYDNEAEDGDNLRMTRSWIAIDGHWEHYRYDALKRIIETITAINTNAYQSDDLDALRSENLVESVLHLNIDLADSDQKEERITRRAVIRAGEVELVRYKIEWSQSHPAGDNDPETYEEWQIEAEDIHHEADFADLKHFFNSVLAGEPIPEVTIKKIRRFEEGLPNEFELVRVEESDGSFRDFRYPQDGVVVITQGHLDRTGQELINAIRTTRTTDASDRLLSIFTEEYLSNPFDGEPRWVVASLEKRLTKDAFGRATSTGYYLDDLAAAEYDKPGSQDPEYVTRQTFGPHGVETRTDKEGRVTRYSYDGLGRLTSVVLPDGQVINYTRDGEGRIRRLFDPKDDDPLLPSDDWPNSGRLQMI